MALEVPCSKCGKDAPMREILAYDGQCEDCSVEESKQPSGTPAGSRQKGGKNPGGRVVHKGGTR